jgi:murein L,D-transpeptidase YafK
MGKDDKTPYEIKECLRTLYQGKEFIASAHIDKVIVHKNKRKLYGYKSDKVVVESKISLGKNGDKGHKIKSGDYKTPEGHYRLTRKKCDKRLFRSLLITYPDKVDSARARKLGVNPGGYITIHGQPKWNADGRGDSYTLKNDWTEGCIAVPNKVMEKLWAGIKSGTPITIYP